MKTLTQRLLPQFQQKLQEKNAIYPSYVAPVVEALDRYELVGDLPYRIVCEMYFLFGSSNSPFEFFEELS